MRSSQVSRFSAISSVSFSFSKTPQLTKKILDLENSIIKNGTPLLVALENAVTEYYANSNTRSFNLSIFLGTHNAGKKRADFLHYHISQLKKVDINDPPNIAVLICISHILMCSTSRHLKRLFVQKINPADIFSDEIIGSSEDVTYLLNRAITQMSLDYPTKKNPVFILAMYLELKAQCKTFNLNMPAMSDTENYYAPYFSF